ncbi:MAG: mannose-6-phosphate isomerase, class I [Chitinophagaceae bacterium]
MQGTGQLTGTVKHYDWGGHSFIPALLGITAEAGTPYAEYWLGVHPQADCRVTGGAGAPVLLRDIINQQGENVLGKEVFEQFGTLPFLLKALDVKQMLSIQVHPSREEARKDFARENEAGIPLDSPQRNYKDDNHKPELMAAMGGFWLLHGFRPEAAMKQVLNEVPELQPLAAVFEQSGYQGLYSHVMQLPQEQVNEQLQPLLDRIVPLYQAGKLDKGTPDYWAARGALTFSGPGKTDRGIFSVYLFNLVRLEEGEAIFQDAGVPHAYLEGQNVEIMASSDNVLRGGLTTKHIDVKELLKHVKCEPTHPNILKGIWSGPEKIYRTPAPDFELSVFDLPAGGQASFMPHTTEILLLVKGKVAVQGAQSEVILKQGAPAAVVFPGAAIRIDAAEPALVFRATVPAAGGV